MFLSEVSITVGLIWWLPVGFKGSNGGLQNYLFSNNYNLLNTLTALCGFDPFQQCIHSSVFLCMYIP